MRKLRLCDTWTKPSQPLHPAHRFHARLVCDTGMLLCAYQFAMRPIQIAMLSMRNVRIWSDVAGRLANCAPDVPHGQAAKQSEAAASDAQGQA